MITTASQLDRSLSRCESLTSNLMSLLQLRAEKDANRRAFTFLREDGGTTSLTFGELDRRARSIAASIQESAQRGARVLLVYTAGLDFIEAFFGCVYAGVLAIPATYPKPKRPMPRLAAITRDSEAVIALTTTQTMETLELARTAPELAALRWVATDSLTNGEDRWQRPEISPDHIAFLQYTSGSTSEPKGVMVSHGNLLHNLEIIRRGFDLESAPDGEEAGNGAFWLPAYHDMGLIGGILEPLYVGGHSILMAPTSFLQRPLRWLQTISENKCRVSGAPNFAYELCTRKITPEERDSLDLSHWELAFCGAEPIRPETLERFADFFGPCGFKSDAFYPCYGLAESTLLVSGGHGPGRPIVKAVKRSALAQNRVVEANGDQHAVQRLVGCGFALFDQDVLIVDSETQRPLDENHVGEIWIKGPSVTQGYWNRTEETEHAFRGFLADGTGPFLRTGDLGFLSESQLYITGRVKDVIIIRGRNLYPQDIELTVEESHEMLQLGGGAAFAVDIDGQERLVVVHEVERQYRNQDLDEVFKHVRRAVTEEHELDLHAIVLIRQASLARTTSGKVQRSLTREQYLAGELKVLADWVRPDRVESNAVHEGNGHASRAEIKNRFATPTDLKFGTADSPLTADEIDRLAERIETWLLDWLVARAGVSRDDIARDKPFAEYGLDSLTAVELSQELEDWLKVRLTPVIAWNYPTPMAMSRYLAQQVSGVTTETETTTDSPTPAKNEFEDLLAEIENLSDEEVDAALHGRL